MLVISALRRPCWQNSHEFKASFGCIVRFYLKKKQKQKNWILDLIRYLFIKLVNPKDCFSGLRDDSEVKSTYCSCWRPKFGSQDPGHAAHSYRSEVKRRYWDIERVWILPFILLWFLDKMFPSVPQFLQLCRIDEILMSLLHKIIIRIHELVHIRPLKQFLAGSDNCQLESLLRFLLLKWMILACAQLT